MGGLRKARHFIYIGTNAEEGGIRTALFESGKLSLVAEYGDTPRPSYLAIDPLGRALYAVNEIEEFDGNATGSVSAFGLDHGSGKLALLNRIPSRGQEPCHLSIDAKGRFLLVANYRSGTVAVVPVRQDGSLLEALQVVHQDGSGPRPEQQDGAHAHCVTIGPGNRVAYVADLGSDKLLVYRFDSLRGGLQPSDVPWVRMNDGMGPRHFEFHPSRRFAYLIGQFDSTINLLAYDEAAGTMRAVQALSMVPEEWLEPNWGGEVHVHPGGRFVYGSNRGHDSIAAFSVGENSGTLLFLGHVPSGGRNPRSFTIDPSGSFLLVANQDSDRVSVLAIDQQTGLPSPTGRELEVPAPSCVAFGPAR